jgi:hypothetical protein
VCLVVLALPSARGRRVRSHTVHTVLGTMRGPVAGRGLRKCIAYPRPMTETAGSTVSATDPCIRYPDFHCCPSARHSPGADSGGRDGDNPLHDTPPRWRPTLRAPTSPTVTARQAACRTGCMVYFCEGPGSLACAEITVHCRQRRAAHSSFGEDSLHSRKSGKPSFPKRTVITHQSTIIDPTCPHDRH